MAQGSEKKSREQELSYNDVLDILDIADGIGEGCELTVSVRDFHLHIVKEAGEGTPIKSDTSIVTSSLTTALKTLPLESTPPTENKNFVSGRIDSDLLEVVSPMVGTFYRRPAPDKPPFVEVGQEVGPNDAVCLVEVMKLFNTIIAGTTGCIMEICVEEAAPVTVGQVLMRIKP